MLWLSWGFDYKVVYTKNTNKVIYNKTPTNPYIAGGRTMLVYLCPGDTLELYCRDCSPAGVGHTTLCVSLATSHTVV